jgi:hypothetical protein
MKLVGRTDCLGSSLAIGVKRTAALCAATAAGLLPAFSQGQGSVSGRVKTLRPRRALARTQLLTLLLPSGIKPQVIVGFRRARRTM